jgi:hypothetical protein
MGGCVSETDGSESVGQVASAINSLPNSGIVAFPIQIDPTTLQPKIGSDGKPLSAWDRSLPDLLAADAYAQCVTTGWDYKSYPDPAPNPAPAGWTTSTVRRFSDSYLEGLRAAMAASTCPGGASGLTTAEKVWLDRRNRAECNYDTQRGATRAATISSTRDIVGYDTFTPITSSYFGITSPGVERELAARRASRQLGYADVNLCMAAQLRENLENPESLFLSRDEQAQMLSIILGRTTAAVQEFGLLAKVASSADPVTTAIDHDNLFLPMLRKWFDAAPRTRIVDDFAASTRLHGAALLDYMNFMRREASARWTSAPLTTSAEADFGPKSARYAMQCVLNGWCNSENPTAASRGTVIGGSAAILKSSAIEDPLANTLLGLARQADAVFWNDSPTPAQQDSIYTTTEVNLRLKDCVPPATCTLAAIQAALPPITQFKNYLLWKRYAIAPETGRALHGAIGAWRNRLMVLGQHPALGRFSSEFSLRDKPVIMATASRPGVPKLVYFDAQPEDQGFVPVPKTQSPSTKYLAKTLGAVPVLAFAREALFDWGAKFTSGATFTLINQVTAELASLVGPRTTVIHRKVERSVVATPCPANESCKRVVLSAGSDYSVDVLTVPTDPFNFGIKLDIDSANNAGYEAVLAHPGSTSISGGLTRASLDATARVSPTATTGTGASAGRVLRSFPFATSLNFDRAILSDVSSAAAGPKKYVELGALPDISSPELAPLTMPQSNAIASGGQIGALVAQTWATSTKDRSRPAFDAFGIPRDWVPPADASLVGGQVGEGTYQYYLRSAAEASHEAAEAVQTAIDGLLTQAESEVSTAEAEATAKNIAKSETTALCGAAASCDLPLARFTAVIPTCTGACDDAMGSVKAIVRQVQLASEVISAPIGFEFDNYRGGEIQRVLIRQLSARDALNAAIAASYDRAKSYAADLAAADSRLSAATAEHTAADAEMDAALAALDQQDAEVVAGLAEITSLEADVTNAVAAAEATRVAECDPTRMYDAMKAGRTFGGVDMDESLFWSDSYDITYKSDQVSFNSGPWLDQIHQCQDATREATRLFLEQTKKLDALTQRRAELIAKRDDLTPDQREAITQRKLAAEAGLTAAKAAATESCAASWTQISAQATQLQAAAGELASAGAELSAVKLRAANAISKANLEAALAVDTIAARLAINRRFRSYDLWRARALLESARRISVAARRAIESRFVVNLSEIEAAQAFVDAPSRWADTVYQSDLSPSASIGLTGAPTKGSGVSVNKLADYVENLKRFVEGYTLTYPTSVAAPDTEVLTLIGPDARQVLRGGAEVVAEGARGWHFYCPDTGTWVSHPGLAEIPLVKGADKACSGARPTKIKRSFTLGPWGGLEEPLLRQADERRHNVRARRIAVNLVGTGVRDCQQSNDPTACYSEAFLRFDLAHAGPAWMTTQRGGWRVIDMPTAFIHSGKALAVEEWLDPVTISWETGFVSNVAKGELQGRPVGGSYELIIDVPRDVVLSRIERVQLLLEMDYWVAQQ